MNQAKGNTFIASRIEDWYYTKKINVKITLGIWG